MDHFLVSLTENVAGQIIRPFYLWEPTPTPNPNPPTHTPPPTRPHPAPLNMILWRVTWVIGIHMEI